MKSNAPILFISLFFFYNSNVFGQSGTDYSTPIKNHFQKLISSGTDTYGATPTPVWMSSLDPMTGQYPENDQRPDSIPQRVYLDRSVSAPKGATAYWDFPNFAAAMELSRLSGDSTYRGAAKRYLTFYLENCKADNGIILWGNHYYYDAFLDQCLKFKSSEEPQPVDFNTEMGDLYEARPFAPVLDILWEIDPVLTEKHLRQTINGHIVDIETGEFNRHADGERGYAFIEYGGLLTYSLLWLYDKTWDTSLLDLADRIIHYTYEHRNKATGLLENSPTQDRWDKYTATTEVGLWAGYVLKASQKVPDQLGRQWQTLASRSLARWLIYGWDEETGLYFGGLNITDGSPFEPQPDYPYQPDKYADIFNPLFPTHNYPMQLAEATLEMYLLTKNSLYETHTKNWLRHVRKQVNERNPEDLLYAENYARIIHFLKSYHAVFKDPESKKLMQVLASEALANLYLEEARMFRSHTGESRYDAVDGVGLLALVLLEIEYGFESEYGESFY
tara:strand:+ start:3210 stop:4718 length:1509 start_codon:yes stop_codon:yes gene_type:complete